jgi:hypothetical protein
VDEVGRDEDDQEGEGDDADQDPREPRGDDERGDDGLGRYEIRSAVHPTPPPIPALPLTAIIVPTLQNTYPIFSPYALLIVLISLLAREATSPGPCKSKKDWSCAMMEEM